MGTRKTPVRTFEESLGLDLTSSALTRDPQAAVDFLNIERLFDGSFRGREGYKLAAQPLYTLKMHRYVYLDENNEEQEELICAAVLNPDRPRQTSTLLDAPYEWYGGLFRLKQENFQITYSGASYFDVRVVFDTGTESLHLKLFDGATEVLDEDLGSGVTSSPLTLYELKTAIDAVTDFVAVCPQTAVLNGAQTASPFTVDSGHTITKQAWIYVKEAFSTFDNFFECLTVGATSVTLLPGSVSLADNEVIGHGLYPAAILSLRGTAIIASAGTVNLPYYYWEPIPAGTFTIPSPSGAGTTYEPNSKFLFKDTVANTYCYGENFAEHKQPNPSFVNQNNCAYFTASYATKVPMRKYIGDINGYSPERIDFDGGVWKYDGKDVSLSGPINFYAAAGYTSPTWPAATLTGSSGLANGDYKYQFSVLKKDYRGNEIESFLEFTSNVTVSSGPKTVRYALPMYGFASDYLFPYKAFDIRHTAATATASSATNTFSVTSDHLLRTGDTVFFKDNSGVFQERKVAGWTQTTIVLDKTATITSGNAISVAAIRAWRTKASGSEYFLATAIPLTFAATTLNFDDATADSSLGININAVKQTSIQYPFPRAKSLAVHQGLLSAAGGDLKNQIAWEDSLYLECLDYARNVAPVSNESAAQVTKIVSGSSSTLYALQQNDIAEATGSFGESAVETTSTIKNSYGVSGPDAVALVKQALFMVSNLGLAVLGVGGNDVTQDKTLLRVFRELDNIGTPTLVPKIVTEKATVFWDSEKNWIHIVLPFDVTVDDTAGTSGLEFYVPGLYSRHFVLQLPQTPEQSPLMAEFKSSQVTTYFPAAGFANHDGKLFFASRTFLNSKLNSFLLQRLSVQEDAAEEDLFSDNGKQYQWTCSPQWDDAGEPEYQKIWHEFELYQLQPDNFVAAFDISFVSYRDWQVSTSKRDTVRTLSFTSSTDLSQKIQFDPGYKAKRRLITLSGYVNKNPFVFTGYSYTVDETERRQDRFGR